MPDPAKPPEDDPSKSSTKIKLTLPQASVNDKSQHTQLEVDPGTREHNILVSEVSEAPSQIDHNGPERRKQPAPVQVLMQQAPPAGGLFGKWANIANMSAVGLIMAVFVWILFSVRADERERRGQEREDRINDRSQTQSAFAALTASMATMTSRSDAREARGEVVTARLDAFLEESRQARQEMKQTQVEILKVLRAILDKKKMEPEEATAAPMPRAKAVGSG